MAADYLHEIILRILEGYILLLPICLTAYENCLGCRAFRNWMWRIFVCSDSCSSCESVTKCKLVARFLGWMNGIPAVPVICTSQLVQKTFLYFSYRFAFTCSCGMLDQVKSYYGISRNLLIKFKDDMIDETLMLAQLLSSEAAISSMLDMSTRSLPGNHGLPLQQVLPLSPFHHIWILLLSFPRRLEMTGPGAEFSVFITYLKTEEFFPLFAGPSGHTTSNGGRSEQR